MCGGLVLLHSSKKIVQSGVAFNSLYFSKYFGMVTTEQKEGKCVEHVLGDSQLIHTSNPQV